MIPVLPTITEPTGLDRALAPLLDAIGTVPWIQFAAGKATPTYRQKKNGGTWIDACVFDGNRGDMISVLPNDQYGAGFSFIDAPKGEEVTERAGGPARVKVDLGVVVFLNLADAYTDYTDGRTVEHAKTDIVSAIDQARRGASTWRVLKITDRLRDVYLGYEFDRVQAHLLNRPFAAFRVDLQLMFDHINQCP